MFHKSTQRNMSSTNGSLGIAIKRKAQQIFSTVNMYIFNYIT